MTIQDLTCFLKLAENLNYTKTAEELFISQPAVTRHINSLEDELNVKLFDRSIKKNITLTEAGAIYYKGLKKCKSVYEDTMNSISSKIISSPLIINFARGTSIPDEYVDATASFMDSHPNFHHFTNFIEPSDFSNVLDNGEVLICRAEEAQKHTGCKTMQLTQNPISYYLVANKKHPGFKNPDAPDFDSIRNTTLFLPKNLPDKLKNTFFGNIKNLLGEMPVEVMYLDSMDSVGLFLRSGRCFSVANGWQSILDSKNHVSYKMDFGSHFVAIWNPSKCTHPQVKAYLDTLKALAI